MVTLAQVNFFILTDTFNMCHPSYESMSQWGDERITWRNIMSSKQAAQDTGDRRHAVVIGASMAGLLAARVLSDHFAQVTIIERDRLTADAEARKGVPQGRHVHGLLNASMLNLRNIEPRKRTNSRYQAEVDKPYSANLLWKHIARGAIIMGEYFPDLFRTLARDGAIPVGTEGVRWNQLGVWMAPVRSPVTALFQSRPFLEQHVRDQLAARDTVRIRDGCEVSQLCAHNDRITAY
jgi:hypothetical protein